MLATLKSLKTVMASKGGPSSSNTETLSSREGVPSQEGTHTRCPGTSQKPPSSFNPGVVEFEEPDSDQSSFRRGGEFRVRQPGQ